MVLSHDMTTPTTGTRLYVIYEAEEEGNFEEEKSGGRKRKAIEMEDMVQSAHGGLGDLDLWFEIDLMLPHHHAFLLEYAWGVLKVSK